MINPRDPQTRFGIPIDYETGTPLEDVQLMRMQKISDAADLLYAAMHESEGSSLPGLQEAHVFQTRLMAVAGTHLETAVMFARKAVVRG
jgi:hypothetical protein